MNKREIQEEQNIKKKEINIKFEEARTHREERMITFYIINFIVPLLLVGLAANISP